MTQELPQSEQQQHLMELAATIPRPDVEPDDLLAEAARKLLRYHFSRMLLHEEGTRLEEDTEELHDMRVAIRRMRSVFNIFGSAFKSGTIKPHIKGLRATGRALGRARDLDVFIAKSQSYLATLPPEAQAGLDSLLADFEQERKGAQATMLPYLDSKAYRNFKRKYSRFLNTPGSGARKVPGQDPDAERVRFVAPIMIYSQLARVRAYEASLDTASIERLHQLRIEVKRLRYTIESLREVLGSEKKAVIRELIRLQDHLGDLNDADVACHVLGKYLDSWRARQVDLSFAERQDPEPVVAFLAAKQAERHHLLGEFGLRWERFMQSDFRKNLAWAVAVL